MKKITIHVTDCVHCPNIRYGISGSPRCNQVRDGDYGRDIPAMFCIPEWCPLEDYILTDEEYYQMFPTRLDF